MQRPTRQPGGMLRGEWLYPTASRLFFEKNPRYTRTTRSTWDSVFQRLQKRHPDKRLIEFTADDLAQFLNVDEKGKPRRSGATISSYRVALQAMFRWAVYAGLIDRDPTTWLRHTVRVKRHEGRRQNTWLTPEQITAVMSTTKGGSERDLRDRILLQLGILTGLRISEIARLRWDQVDLAAQQIHLYGHDDGVHAVGKGSKAATVPMAPQLFKALIAWKTKYTEALGRDITDEPVIPKLKNQPAGATLRNERGQIAGSAGGRVVTVNWGRPAQVRSLRDAVQERGEMVGLSRPFNPHDMRRTFAGHLERDNRPIEQISKLMRHESVATTHRYLEDNPAKLHQFIEGFGIDMGDL